MYVRGVRVGYEGVREGYEGVRGGTSRVRAGYEGSLFYGGYIRDVTTIEFVIVMSDQNYTKKNTKTPLKWWGVFFGVLLSIGLRFKAIDHSLDYINCSLTITKIWLWLTNFWSRSTKFWLSSMNLSLNGTKKSLMQMIIWSNRIIDKKTPPIPTNSSIRISKPSLVHRCQFRQFGPDKKSSVPISYRIASHLKKIVYGYS
jgi:hypothetical protein